MNPDAGEPRIAIRFRSVNTIVVLAVFPLAILMLAASFWATTGLTGPATVRIIKYINISLLAVFGAGAVVAGIDMQLMYDDPVCVRCGYPRDGDVDTCPECGSDLSREGAVAKRRPWRKRERKVIGLSVAFAALFINLLLYRFS